MDSLPYAYKGLKSQSPEYYAEEAAAGKWSVRQLERQIATQYYERLLSTHRDSEEVESLIKKNLPAKPDKFDPRTLVHDPFVLEFVGAKEDVIWQESELESALISHLEEFLLELGRGFAFMGRQKRITIDGQHFYPDLVFYKRPDPELRHNRLENETCGLQRFRSDAALCELL